MQHSLYRPSRPSRPQVCALPSSDTAAAYFTQIELTQLMGHIEDVRENAHPTQHFHIAQVQISFPLFHQLKFLQYRNIPLSIFRQTTVSHSRKAIRLASFFNSNVLCSWGRTDDVVREATYSIQDKILFAFGLFISQRRRKEHPFLSRNPRTYIFISNISIIIQNQNISAVFL